MKAVKYLVSPKADFWLLGGASLVAWLLLTLADQFAPAQAVVRRCRDPVGYLAIVLFSYPHFAASYWLCYSRGRAFMRENWFAMIAVPSILIAGLIGLWLSYAKVGDLQLSIFLTLFLFFSGWHFAMQAFGACVISFYYDGVRLDPRQRLALKTCLITLWLFFFLSRFDYLSERTVFFGVEMYFIELPYWAYYPAGAVLAAVTLWAVYLLVLKPFDKTGRWPSGRSVVAWVSLYFWWLPALRSAEFYLYGTQIFHGLQQHAFTYRFERERGGSQFRIFLLAIALVAVGYFVHRTVPVAMDQTTLSPRPNYFFLCFSFSISIHHYFLDRANFRMRNPETRRLLLGDVAVAPAAELATASPSSAGASGPAAA